MTAAYRLKGIGWMALLVGVVLGFYLVSLQVAAERKKLDDANVRIGAATRDIRALETEFDTRANLAQLERWNGDTLALAVPTAAQFVSDDTALASLDPHAVAGPEVRTAALVVPALMTPPTPAANAPVEAPRAAPVAIAASQPARAAPPGVAHHEAKPETVALLDRKLLSDSTFGDIASRARREARR